jgi:hypothetical protein
MPGQANKKKTMLRTQWDIIDNVYMQSGAAIWAMAVYSSTFSATDEDIKTNADSLVGMVRKWLHEDEQVNVQRSQKFWVRNLNGTDSISFECFVALSCCMGGGQQSDDANTFLLKLREWYISHVESKDAWPVLEAGSLSTSLRDDYAISCSSSGAVTVKRVGRFTDFAYTTLDGGFMDAIVVWTATRAEAAAEPQQNNETAICFPTEAAFAVQVANAVKEWTMQQMVLDDDDDGSDEYQDAKKQILISTGRAGKSFMERAKYFMFTKKSRTVHHVVEASVEYAQRAPIADPVSMPGLVEKICEQMRDWLVSGVCVREIHEMVSF